MSTTPPTFWEGLSEMLGNPNTQIELNNVAYELDPQGFGGRLAQGNNQIIRGKAAQNLAAKQLAGAEADRRELREMNRKLLERLGPVTPQGTPGLNGVKE